MSVAQRFGPNTKPVSHLPIATVYRLAAPSTPNEVRDRIVARLENGEVIPPVEIDGEIADARREDERERDLAKKSPEARARAKAARERQVRDHAAATARYREEREREDAARMDAADLIVERLNSDDLDRLVELMDGRVDLRRKDILEARSRGGVS